jgi:hypothetical protein
VSKYISEKGREGDWELLQDLLLSFLQRGAKASAAFMDEKSAIAGGFFFRFLLFLDRGNTAACHRAA